MTSFAIELSPQPSVAIAGSTQRFPVGRIYCVGRNYADHAREMGHDPDREDPFFFMKPANTVVDSGASLPYPTCTKDVHHEIELVIALHKGGANIAQDQALDHVWGYGVGLDMTRRDLQAEAKKAGRPWEMGKAFDQSAPCAPLHPASQVGHISKGAIWVKVNGVTKQQGDIAQLIWNIPEMLAYLSKLVTLQAGDLIYTGTPAGVGPVKAGETLDGHVDGLTPLQIKYV